MRLSYSAKFTISALLFSILSTYSPDSADAKDKYFDLPPQCPIAAPIRVASAGSLGDILSLRACAQQVVHSPPAPILVLPPVARIQGIKVAIPAADEPAPAREAAASDCPGCTAYKFAPHRSALQFDGVIRRTAGTYRIDPLFLHALTWTESAYRPDAVSSAGARGLMQIMPGTGRDLGVAHERLFDPVTNIDAGARLLKKLQRRYGRNLSLILAAYNAGEGAVEKYGRRIPPYRETQNYVRTVMQRYGSLRGTGGGLAGGELVR